MRVDDIKTLHRIDTSELCSNANGASLLLMLHRGNKHNSKTKTVK